MEVVNQISRRTGIDRCEFDSNPNIINLQNGLLSIRTLRLDKHSPNNLSLIQLPIKYKKGAKCPKITKFLNQVLKPKDVSTALQLIGYCLYKSAKFQKALMCVGKGSNGKSVFLELIGRFLGEANVSHISLQDLCDDRFAKAGLFGKAANIFSDLPLDLIKDSQAFKTLVSGDSIMAQEKYRDKFYFHNYAKLFFSANRIPASNDDTYAYFRRWIIFSFENISSVIILQLLSWAFVYLYLCQLLKLLLLPINLPLLKDSLGRSSSTKNLLANKQLPRWDRTKVLLFDANQ